MKTDLKTSKQYNEGEFRREMNINISEVTLTPSICASLINEILKGLLYQKCQIPYPYSWLKSVVDKKRKTVNEKQNEKANFTVENHFKTVSEAYDILDEIMSGISNSFKETNSHIKEVNIIFGTTPYSPKEMFTIKVDSLAYGHLERNHVDEMNKLQPKILRSIFLSQVWLDTVDASQNCTNTYVFIKKHISEDKQKQTDSFFIPSRPLSVPSNVKQMVINLSYKNNSSLSCCENLSVYDDTSNSSEFVKQSHHGTNLENSDNNEQWFQSKTLLKGFRDCFINKVSACELW